MMNNRPATQYPDIATHAERSSSESRQALDTPEVSDGLAAVPPAVIAWDGQKRLIGWNAAAETMFGRCAEEVLGVSVTEVFATTLHDVIAELLTPQSCASPVCELTLRDGRTILCEWQQTLLNAAEGAPAVTVTVIRDVTQQRQAERERENLLERQRRLMEIAAGINAGLELDRVLRLVRDAVVEVGGFDRAGVFRVEGGIVHGAWGTNPQGGVQPEHDFSEPLAEWGAYIHDLASGREKFVIIEGDTSGKPGSHIASCAVLGMRTGGELKGLLCVDNLLSGRLVLPETVSPLLPFCEEAAVAIANTRLLAERTRHESRQRRLTILAAAICASTALNAILRMVRDAIVEGGGFDRAGVFLVDAPRGMLYGTWGTDRQGRPEDLSHWRLPVHPAEGATDRPMQRVARGELDYYRTSDLSAVYPVPADHPLAGVHAYALVPLRVNGGIVGIVSVDNLLSDAPISEEDIRGILPFADLAAVAIQNAHLFDDLSQAQDALIRSEKLRAVGELASGVAHNVNNVLAAALGYAELIQTAEGATPEIKTHARTIERAAMDGAEIVRRMQHFARLETESGRVAFDLAVTTQEAVDLTRPAWHTQAAARGANIVLTTDLTPGLWTLGIASEIREVIVNLLKNAADAMPQGGTLTVRAFTDDGQAALEVRDTGEGMEEHIRQRLFEPFFTTKGSGLGMGLGLSVTWGIIHRHQGQIEAESAPGQGSVFKVRLPLAGEGAPEVDAEGADATLAGMRVLLVEDEELVLGGLARALTARGAVVAVAEDAADAQEWLAAHAAECDLILSDHGMIGLTGMELLARVRERYPHIRRVLLSGWGTNLPGEIDVSAAELMLMKPIGQESLAAALASLQAPPPLANEL